MLQLLSSLVIGLTVNLTLWNGPAPAWLRLGAALMTVATLYLAGRRVVRRRRVSGSANDEGP